MMKTEKPGYKIKSAKFHGEGLMQSKELDELIDQGFHLIGYLGNVLRKVLLNLIISV